MADDAVGRFPEAPERPGAVILARHGEPALSRRCKLSADQYREWWADYETGGLAADQMAPPDLVRAAEQAGFIIASTRLRSVESARALAHGRAFAEDPLFVEAPLPPPHWPGWLRLSPRYWGFISRFWWWFFNHHDQQESRAGAQARADEAAKLLIDLAATGQDVLVVAHGFFNGLVGRSLRAAGWRCTLDGGFRYWAARRFEARPSAGKAA
ncbi:MAG TPA: histidine phosphatase family protein [Caulobacteraceae bacterium]|nr:histidine phosphatase family protein [Caulobacteraceae bacterium]